MTAIDMETIPEIEVFELDLDEEVLSHLGASESVLAFRAERLDPQVIEDDFVRNVYDWQMNHYREHGKPATASVLCDEFDLSLSDPLTAVGQLIKRLRYRWIDNNARQYMTKVSDAYKDDPEGVPQTMIRVGRELSKVIDPIGESYGTGDYDRVLSAYDKSALQGPGAFIGFDEMDSYFHGFKAVSMIVGPPKSRKSWIKTASMLENIRKGKTVWEYSLELPAVESNQRLYTMAANIPPWKWLKGGLTKEDRKLLRETSEMIDESGYYRLEKPPQGKRDLESMVEHARDNGADVIYIDQLQYLEARGRQLGAEDHKSYWTVLNQARDLSDDGPIVLIHQFNRTTIGADKMPEMQQAKGAAACEEVCSLILGLWSNKSMSQSGIVHYGSIAGRYSENQIWEIALDMTHGCKYECVGIVEDEE